MLRGNEIVGIVEVKGNWTLTDPDILRPDSNFHVKSAIKQTYSYMVRSKTMYGIITTYDMTWFLRRVSASRQNERLEISRVFYLNQSSPTLLEALSYFNTLVNSEVMEAPECLRRTSVNSVDYENGDLPVDRNVRSDKYVLQKFSEGVIPFGVSIGCTRYCDVKMSVYNNMPIALKMTHIDKLPDIEADFKNEVEIYRILQDLQGKYIPNFIFTGLIAGYTLCIGLQHVGNIPKSLSMEQKQHLLVALSEIHIRGVIHNDIRKENILVDKDERAFIIDFGYSSMNSSREEQQEEMFHFRRLLEDL